MLKFVCSASKAEVVCRARWQLYESTLNLQTRKGFSTATGPDGSPIKVAMHPHAQIAAFCSQVQWERLVRTPSRWDVDEKNFLS